MSVHLFKKRKKIAYKSPHETDHHLMLVEAREAMVNWHLMFARKSWGSLILILSKNLKYPICSHSPFQLPEEFKQAEQSSNC